MDESELIEVARQLFEELREQFPRANVSANGKFVRAAKPGGIFVAECGGTEAESSWGR